MRRGWGSEAERESVRVAFPNGSWSLDFQTPFGASNARNVVSSSSGGGGGGGYCENHRATRCRRAVWQEVQQEVQADVQLGNKMAAGDSAKTEWEQGWGSLLWAESMSGLSEWKQSLYQASKSLNCWKGNTSPPSKQPLSHPLTVLPHFASFFTHCVKFLFFLILFTFWRLSLCSGCGKVSRNGEVIHHQQLPPPQHTHTQHNYPNPPPPPSMLSLQARQDCRTAACPTSSSSALPTEQEVE